MGSSIWQAALGPALVLLGCSAAAPVVEPLPAAPRAAPPAVPAVPPVQQPGYVGCIDPDAFFSKAKYAQRPLTPAQTQAIADAEAYIRAHPSPDSPRGRVELAEHELARARVLFGANRWAEAAVAFRAIAVSGAALEPGARAAVLYVESINMLASESEPTRPNCYEDMARDVPTFMELYCAPRKVREHGDACLSLRRVQRDLERPTGDGVESKAERVEDDSQKLYARAGDRYLELARRCCDETRRFGGRPEAEGCDEIAYNAGQAFLKARQPERAREALAVLLDPDNRMDRGRLAQALAKALGGDGAPP